MQQSNELMRLLLTSMQTTLQALGELRAETRGNRQAMLQRTGDMMQRFDQRIEDLATRFDERIDRSETELFELSKRTEHAIAGQEGRIRALEQRPAAVPAEKSSWLATIAAGLKIIPIGQVLAMVGALVLALLGILSPGEIKALVVKQL